MLITCLCISGCSKTPEYTGKTDIEKARSLHTGLESAKLTMTDNISGEAIQEIEYLFVGEVMTYMYMGKAGGKTYYEYNNGTELDFVTLPDEKEWSFVAKGSEGYYTYSKLSRHYFADGDQLFAVYPTAISDVVLTEGEDGSKTYAYMYNAEALKDYEAFEGMGDIAIFTMTYNLDSDGYCTRFTNDYTMDDINYSYTVEISEMNGIEKIERTEVLL